MGEYMGTLSNLIASMNAVEFKLNARNSVFEYIRKCKDAGISYNTDLVDTALNLKNQTATFKTQFKQILCGVVTGFSDLLENIDALLKSKDGFQSRTLEEAHASMQERVRLCNLRLNQLDTFMMRYPAEGAAFDHLTFRNKILEKRRLAKAAYAITYENREKRFGIQN